MENTSFKYEFINQVCYAMSTAFGPENANRLIDSLADIYRPEMARHFKRNGGSVKRWEGAVQGLRNFADSRPTYYLKHTRAVLYAYRSLYPAPYRGWSGTWYGKY